MFNPKPLTRTIATRTPVVGIEKTCELVQGLLIHVTFELDHGIE